MMHSVPGPWLLLLVGLLLRVASSWATILHVPQEFAGIQAALDASADGDTVLVERGTWAGLYISPVHSLTLCSNYLFSHDSTDINETILDGQYAGTILDIVTWFHEPIILCGFTMIHGQGTRTDIYAGCDKGGAINMENTACAVIRDVVFRDCRAPIAGAILNHATVCGIEARGRLEIRNVACYGNCIIEPQENGACINVKSMNTTLIVDKLFYDGSNCNSRPINVYATRKDTVEFSNMTFMNCTKWSSLIISTDQANGASYKNIKIFGDDNLADGMLGIENEETFNGTSTVTITGIEVTGKRSLDEPLLYVRCQNPILEIDSVCVHHNRSLVGPYDNMIKAVIDNRATLRHLDMHDNVSGDSTSHVGTTLLKLQRTSLLDSRIYNNRVILPPDPDASGSGGNYVLGAMVRNSLGDDVHFENLVFENNRVEDLDDYSTLPAFGYTGNYGRELWANGNNVTVDNVLVRNSRQPNIIPETLAGDGISYSGMSYALAFGGGKVCVRNVLLEDCDDGGIDLGGDSLLVDNVILRNVGRAAFYIGDNFSPQAPPYYRFRNVLIENVDAALNHLSPSYQRYSQQAVLQIAVANDYQGIVPRADFENVTVTGCDGMRHLFNFYQPTDFHVRNCLFYDNSYQQLVEWNLPITQDWQYSLAEEAVPGEGNLAGLDPLFDPVGGAPYLSPNSPCIDAGDPDALWNDLEDPANFGFPLWPSLGSLRNDMGYTGGPHASLAPDTSWSALPAWEPRLQPGAFALGAPYPNPFNPATRIPFNLTRPEIVKLSVHNLLGQEVAVLVNGLRMAGRQEAVLDGAGLASGLYFVTLEVDARRETRALTLLR